MKIPAPVRFTASVLILVVLFGACGSLTLGTLDSVQTAIKGNFLDPSFVFERVGHFLRVFGSVLTTATDRNDVPLRDLFWHGFLLTVTFCFITMPLAILLGFVVALMSDSKRRILRVPARAYVEFFRNTPLLVQLLAIYWSLLFLPEWLLNPFTAGVATLTLNYVAYECENIRAGLAAVDRGQGEAAAALGLSRWQALALVEIPQTISVILPPIINDFIYLFKDSSILSLITIVELTEASTGLMKRIPAMAWEFVLTGALIYLVLSVPLSYLARAAEARLKSTANAPQRDLTAVAVQVLAAALIIGIVANIVADGFSVGQIVPHIGQLLAAIALTLVIMAAVVAVLGGIVYLFAALLGRGKAGRSTPAIEEPVVLVTK